MFIVIIIKNVKFLYDCDVISKIANIKKIKLKYVNIFFLIIFKILSFALIFILFVFPCFVFSSISSVVKPFNSSIILFFILRLPFCFIFYKNENHNNFTHLIIKADNYQLIICSKNCNLSNKFFY